MPADRVAYGMRHTLLRDVTYALRHARRHPVTALATVATIALAVGAGTSLVAVLNATLVRPLPYPAGDRLVGLYTQPPGTSARADRNPLHSLDLVRFRKDLRLADAVEGAWRAERALGGWGEPTSVPAARVSPGFLTLLGGRPIAGRLWTLDEDRAGARVVVLGHAIWQRVFGGRDDLVGQTITLDREPHLVIGILNAGFRPSFVASELWTPLGIHEGNLVLPRNTFIQTIARLSPGASPAALHGEIGALMTQLAAESPDTHTGWGAGVVSLRELEFGDNGRAFVMLGVAVVVLMLVAGVNLANLRLARLIAERPQVALRTALGATRWDLVRRQLAEAIVLGAIGGVVSVAMAAVVSPLLVAMDPAAARSIGEVPIDWRVMASALALAVLVSAASGVLPAMREAPAITGALGTIGGRATGSRSDARLRRLLVSSQAGLAIVLLVIGALFTSALVRTARRDPGFDPAGVVAGQLRLPASAYSTIEARARLLDAVLERVRSLPGVVDAGTTQNPFVPGSFTVTGIAIEGRPTPDGTDHIVQFRRVSGGYFSTMRIAVVAGRAFDATDRTDGPKVAMISEALASRFWPGEPAVGKRIIRVGVALEVIGVAADVRDQGPAVAPAPVLYLPHSQSNTPVTPATLVARVDGPTAPAIAAIRRAILDVDPQQPLERVTTIDAFMAATMGPDRFRAALLTLFAGLGLVLTAVGIYGVTACVVEERTREVGIRMVLGARASGVWRLVVGQALRAVAIGGVAGGGVAAALAMFLRYVTPDLAWRDAWTALPAAGVLGVAAVIAAGLPARRAARTDPSMAMKQ